EVAPYRRQVMQVQYGNQNWATAVQGTLPAFFRVTEWGFSSGEAFSERDEDTAARVAVLGQTVVEQLFGVGHDPVGAVIRVKNVPLRVVGVLEEKGQTTWGQDRDDVIVIPFSTAERRVIGTETLGMVDMIQATAVSSNALEEASEQIRQVVMRRHRIQKGEEADFTVRSLDEMARASQTASQVMTNLLLGVAAISLLVGGIGIMNILLVSVTERTREIGIRMAVGAKSRHILLQFLVESVTLSFLGGLAGVVLGIVASIVISRLSGWPTLLSPGAVAGAFVFSGAVGVFFGFYPARKASRLDPITALRYE
ncbi:MAG TPA: ABC transporter permease, partial [Terriglobales bacterium]|nr:ABC transporter permease [Terriglobales bacterium]